MKRILSTFLLSIALLFPNISGATINWANNATSLIADSGGISAGATSVTVTTGEGDKFPAVASPHYFMITFVDVSANREIVKVTARASGSNTMTIVRGQEGTSPRAFAEGSFVDQRITAGSLDVFSHTASAFENYYVCDASATDQADTVNDNSLASLTGDIGTTLNATIILPHSGTGSTTAYNVLQNLDLSTYDNITYIIERGSIITHAANTIDMAIPQAERYQIFSGTGTITFNPDNSGSVYPAWWGIDGTADEVQINLAANALSSAGVVLLGHQAYSTAAVITLPTGITLRGANSTVSKIVPVSTMVKIIATVNSATDVIVEDLWIYGTGDTNTVERGIYGDSPTRLIVRNCRFDNMTYGVQIDNGLRCDVIHNHFNGIVGASGVSEGYGTIITLASSGCKIIGNTYKTIARHAVYITSGTSYCIVSNNSIDAISEGAIEISATTAQNPCTGNQIIDNNINDVTSAASNGHGITLTQYCLDTIISKNELSSIQDYGIFLNGPQSGADTAKKILRGVISNNIINTAEIGIRIQNAEDFVCADNVVYNSTTHGIEVTSTGTDPVCLVKRIKINGNFIRTAGTDGIRIDPLAGKGSEITLGWNDISDITGTDISQAFGIVDFRNIMNPVWIEDVMTFSDFDAASTTPTHNFTITLPAGCIVDGVWWNLDTEFAGGSVSAATLEFGVSGGDVDGFFPAENVFTAAGTGLKDSAVTSRGALLYSSGNNQTLQYFTTATTTFLATLRLTGDNGEDLTAGQVRIWLSYHQVRLPLT